MGMQDVLHSPSDIVLHPRKLESLVFELELNTHKEYLILLITNSEHIVVECKTLLRYCVFAGRWFTLLGSASKPFRSIRQVTKVILY
jgi:hypothetical protein